jgi:hypothetical protein
MESSKRGWGNQRWRVCFWKAVEGGEGKMMKVKRRKRLKKRKASRNKMRVE